MIYIIAVLLVFFEATFLNLIALGGIKPDLALILVVYAGLYKRPLEALSTAVLAGVLRDILSAAAFLNTFLLAACAILVSLFAQRFYQRGKLVESTAVFFVSLAMSFSWLAWLSRRGLAPHVGALFVFVGIPTILYTALVSLPFFHIARDIG